MANEKQLLDAFTLVEQAEAALRDLPNKDDVQVRLQRDCRRWLRRERRIRESVVRARMTPNVIDGVGVNRWLDVEIVAQQGSSRDLVCMSWEKALAKRRDLARLYLQALQGGGGVRRNGEAYLALAVAFDMAGANADEVIFDLTENAVQLIDESCGVTLKVIAASGTSRTVTTSLSEANELGAKIQEIFWGLDAHQQHSILTAERALSGSVGFDGSGGDSDDTD